MNKFQTVRCVDDAHYALQYLHRNIKEVEFHINRISDQEDKNDSRIQDMLSNVEMLKTIARVLLNDTDSFVSAEYQQSQGPNK